MKKLTSVFISMLIIIVSIMPAYAVDTDIIGFEPEPVLEECDSSNAFLTKYYYSYPTLVDYNVLNLSWYFVNGFHKEFDNNFKNYIEVREMSETGKLVPLSHDVIESTSNTYFNLTDWKYYHTSRDKNDSNSTPINKLELSLASMGLKPSTKYVVIFKDGFTFNNGYKTTKCYVFMFTTTSNSKNPVPFTTKSALLTTESKNGTLMTTNKSSTSSKSDVKNHSTSPNKTATSQQNDSSSENLKDKEKTSTTIGKVSKNKDDYENEEYLQASKEISDESPLGNISKSSMDKGKGVSNNKNQMGSNDWIILIVVSGLSIGTAVVYIVKKH